jgi:hypothetical protein
VLYLFEEDNGKLGIDYEAYKGFCSQNIKMLQRGVFMGRVRIGFTKEVREELLTL